MRERVLIVGNVKRDGMDDLLYYVIVERGTYKIDLY